MCWFQGVYELTKVLLRNYPKIGLAMWELSLLQACLEEEYCMNIHVYLQGIILMKRVGKIQGWSRLTTRVIQVDQHTKRRRCTEWDQVVSWYVSILHYALCTNPWSTWEFYVGLGMFSWACVKRKISYDPWRMTSSGDHHQGCGAQVQVKHHDEIKCLKLAVHRGDNGHVKMFRRVAHP